MVFQMIGIKRSWMLSWLELRALDSLQSRKLMTPSFQYLSCYLWDIDSIKSCELLRHVKRSLSYASSKVWNPSQDLKLRRSIQQWFKMTICSWCQNQSLRELCLALRGCLSWCWWQWKLIWTYLVNWTTTWYKFGKLTLHLQKLYSSLKIQH